MSLSIYLTVDLYDEYGRLYETKEVFDTNITHNLGPMARECASLYLVLWHPEELDITDARSCVPHLLEGIGILVNDQHKLEHLNPANGWGDHSNLLDVSLEFLNACLRHPGAKIITCR